MSVEQDVFLMVMAGGLQSGLGKLIVDPWEPWGPFLRGCLGMCMLAVPCRVPRSAVQRVGAHCAPSLDALCPGRRGLRP